MGSFFRHFGNVLHAIAAAAEHSPQVTVVVLRAVATGLCSLAPAASTVVGVAEQAAEKAVGA